MKNKKNLDLFEANKELAYSYVYKSKIKIPGYEIEDLFQTALLGLWKACCNYDPKRSMFSTFATNCIKNELLMARRKVISKTRISNFESLDKLIEENDPNSKYTKYTPYIESFEDSIIESIDIDMNNCLTNEEKAILSLKGYMTESEISKLTKPWKLKKIKKKLKKITEDSDE